MAAGNLMTSIVTLVMVGGAGHLTALAWRLNGAASTYGRPSPDQRDDIADNLANVTDHGLLSEQQVRKIAFTSGLPRPAHTPTPPETSPAPAPPPSSMISRLRASSGVVRSVTAAAASLAEPGIATQPAVPGVAATIEGRPPKGEARDVRRAR